MKMFHLPGDGPVQLSPVWSMPSGAIVFRCASDAAPWGWGSPYGPTGAEFNTLDGDYSRMQALNPTPDGYKVTYGFKNKEFKKQASTDLSPTQQEAENARMHKDGYWPYGANHWVYKYGEKVLGYLSWGKRRREHMSCAMKTGDSGFQPPDMIYPEQWATAPAPGYRKQETTSLDPLEMLKKILGATADNIDTAIDAMLNGSASTLGLYVPGTTAPPTVTFTGATSSTPANTSTPDEVTTCAPQAKYDLEDQGSIWFKGVKVHTAELTQRTDQVACAAIRTLPRPDGKPDKYLLYVVVSPRQIGSHVLGKGDPILVGCNFLVYVKKMYSTEPSRLLMDFNPTWDLPRFDDYYQQFVWPGNRDRWNYLTMGDDFKGEFNGSATRASFVLPVFQGGTGYDEHQWPEWENGRQCWTTCVMHLDFLDDFLNGAVERSYEPIVSARSDGSCVRVCPHSMKWTGAMERVYALVPGWNNTTKTIWEVGETQHEERMDYNVDTEMADWQTIALEYDGDEELRMYAKVHKYVHWWETKSSHYREILDADNRNIGAGYANPGYNKENHDREDFLGVTYKFKDRQWTEYQKYTYQLNLHYETVIEGIHSGPFLDPLHGKIPQIQENFWVTAYLYKNRNLWDRQYTYEEHLIRWLAVDLKHDFFSYIEHHHSWDQVDSVTDLNHSTMSTGPSPYLTRIQDEFKEVRPTIREKERWTELKAGDTTLQRLSGVGLNESPGVSWPFMTLYQYHRLGASFLTYFPLGYAPADWIAGSVSWEKPTAEMLAAAKNGLDYNTTRYGVGVPPTARYDVTYPELVRFPPLQLYDYYQIPSWRPLTSHWTETVYAAPLQRFCGRLLANTTPYYDEYARRMSDKTWYVGTYPYQAVTSYEIPDNPRTMITLMYPTLSMNIGTHVANDNKCYAQLTGVGDVGAYLNVPSDARITSLGII